MVDISIIFPAYNEAERIGPTLKLFNNFLLRKGISYEMIVVDDGSTDHTVATVERLQDEIANLKVLSLPNNKGKGCAVRMGMLHASGSIRFFSDADGSTPASEMDKLLRAFIDEKCDVCIGSRYHHDSEIVTAQPLVRRLWSRLANIVVQKILLPGIADPHCGFKAFSADAAVRIFSECTINEWSFDLEVLTLARAWGMRIHEVPVKWSNDERSKGRLSQLPREMYNLYKIKKQFRGK